MDTTDPEIFFDGQGICNHCRQFDEKTSKRWFPNNEGKQKLERLFSTIKHKEKKKEYDCIIGLSGGVDSSYLALLIKDYGLRPLAVHIDVGWNSEIAVHNIERVVKYCGFDLLTEVMDWKEIKDLQLAYLQAGVANQDVIQDHAIFASLYHLAVKNNIKYVINGGNIATESVFPNSWHHDAMDSTNIISIHKCFGKAKLKNYKTIGFLTYFFYYPFIKGMTVVRPLNFIPYHKEEALRVLSEKIGYKEYGVKHGESRFTKFFQNYYLPTKFNQDKRRPHFSSLILSSQLSREDALKELQKPLYDNNNLNEDMAYISKKLGITTEELDNFIHGEQRKYSDFLNWDKRYYVMSKLKQIVEKILRRAVKSYS